MEKFSDKFSLCGLCEREAPLLFFFDSTKSLVCRECLKKLDINLEGRVEVGKDVVPVDDAYHTIVYIQGPSFSGPCGGESMDNFYLVNRKNYVKDRKTLTRIDVEDFVRDPIITKYLPKKIGQKTLERLDFLVSNFDVSVLYLAELPCGEYKNIDGISPERVVNILWNSYDP